ncbi:BrnT family toxin [Nitrospira defluvii]|nr:BrnT family toxin [Nitrospira defluvii]
MIYHFPFVVGFDWDEGNKNKNFLKHRISNSECEQIFFNEPLIILDDAKHSKKERRYAAFGFTDENKKFTVVFTMRSNRIRIISARTINKKERAFYEKLIKENI